MRDKKENSGLSICRGVTIRYGMFDNWHTVCNYSKSDIYISDIHHFCFVAIRHAMDVGVSHPLPLSTVLQVSEPGVKDGAEGHEERRQLSTLTKLEVEGKNCIARRGIFGCNFCGAAWWFKHTIVTHMMRCLSRFAKFSPFPGLMKPRQGYVCACVCTRAIYWVGITRLSGHTIILCHQIWPDLAIYVFTTAPTCTYLLRNYVLSQGASTLTMHPHNSPTYALRT